IRLSREFCSCDSPRWKPVFLDILFPTKTEIVEHYPSYRSVVLHGGWDFFHRELESSITCGTDHFHFRTREFRRYCPHDTNSEASLIGHTHATARVEHSIVREIVRPEIL